MSEPIVTVVISPREGHFLAEQSLLSVFADDCIPFDLIYVDFAAPPEVERVVQAHVASRNFKYVQLEGWVAPSLAKKSVLAEIKTKYVAFIENDMLVERGCLEKLVACAEETGAGLVCPLYLEAGGGRTPTIHMAGGGFVWSDPPERGLVGECLRLQGEPLDRAAQLTREKVDYPEYHYVLGRMDLFGLPEAISDDILLMHEHLDLGLFARAQGMDVIIDPAARATFMRYEPHPLTDFAFFRRRWDAEGCNDSLAAFARKWPIADMAVVDETRPFSAYQLQQTDIRRPGSAGADLAEPMRREELAQTRYALREQAIDRGYPLEDLRTFEECCDLATLVSDGLYRADGRPFLSHVIGTASVLVRYEVRSAVVRAALLHATLNHRPAWMPEKEISEGLRAAGVEALVRGQETARALLTQEEADLGSLNIVGAGVAAILAANEVDMRLSGEYRATGQPDDLSPVALARIAEILGYFSVDGLVKSARESTRPIDVWPLFGAPVRHSSFRLDAPNRRILPA